MRKLILALAVGAAVAGTALAGPHGTAYYGGRVNFERMAGTYQGNGGEFQVGGPGLLLGLDAYVSTTKNLDATPVPSFQTFCIELDETLAQPIDIYVSGQNAALSGPGSHAWGGGTNTNSGDDLDARTAYLYTQFARGVLSDYAYAGTNSYGLDREHTAGTLQKLFWLYEGEIATLADGAGGFTLDADQLLLAADWQAAVVAANPTTIGNVRILQTFKTNGEDAQDLLYLVPVPGAVLLGVLGLGAAGWLKRR